MPRVAISSGRCAFVLGLWLCAWAGASRAQTTPPDTPSPPPNWRDNWLWDQDRQDKSPLDTDEQTETGAAPGAAGAAAAEAARKKLRKETEDAEESDVPEALRKKADAEDEEDPEDDEDKEDEEDEELSPFEHQLSRYHDEQAAGPVRQFGYDSFEDRGDPPLLPAGRDYEIGVGDTLALAIWGPRDVDVVVPVERDGTVRLPLIGSVGLQGMTLGQAEALLRSRYDKQLNQFQISLRVAQVHAMPVHVVGHVHQPGRLQVPSIATVQDALVAAGGVRKTGSLRRIVLRRAGRESVEVDLYRYLIGGDPTLPSTRLKANDTLVVPPCGPMAAVVGRVRRPAIYELSAAGTKLDEVMGFAGGFARLADRTEVQVESAAPDGSVAMRTIDLEDTDPARVDVRDGDVVMVRIGSPRLQKVVYLVGNVSRPGRYAWRQGLRVSDVVTPDTLVDVGFWMKRRDLGSGKQEDVAEQGPAEDLPEPYLDYAMIKRIGPPAYQEQRLTFDLGQALLQGDPQNNLALQPQDVIYIFPRTAFFQRETVTISGHVRQPGRFDYFDGMTVQDLLRLGGGPKLEADRASAMLTRVNLDGNEAGFEHIAVVLPGRAGAGVNNAAMRLQPRDILVVQPLAQYQDVGYVELEGEVAKPGRYAIVPGERLSRLIARAGGYSDDAYLPGAMFYRAAVKKLQKERLQEMIRHLELELARAAQTSASEAATLGGRTDLMAELTRLENLIERVKSAPVQGRMVVQLATPDDLEGTSDDLELQDGDRIVIPRRPESVAVVGAVFNQTAVVHRPGMRVRDYVRFCGGVLKTGDEDHTYIIRANGSADSAWNIRQKMVWDAERHRFIRQSIFDFEIQPGDTIVVPHDLSPRLSRLGLVKTIVEITYQTALSAGVIIAAL